MASVEPPDVWYDLHLPDSIINEGKLSALQVKTSKSKFDGYVIKFSMSRSTNAPVKDLVKSFVVKKLKMQLKLLNTN
jgi:hypothetical protein